MFQLVYIHKPLDFEIVIHIITLFKWLKLVQYLPEIIKGK